MGTSYYQLKAYHRTENRYKIPQEEIDVAQCILKDAGEGEYVNILFPQGDTNWPFIRSIHQRLDWRDIPFESRIMVITILPAMAILACI